METDRPRDYQVRGVAHLLQQQEGKGTGREGKVSSIRGERRSHDYCSGG